MADQAKWLKLWESALTDADLENLDLENWARYVRLMLYIKVHGHNGKIRFPDPFRAIKNLLRIDTLDAIKSVLKVFPNCTYDAILRPQKSDGENIVTLEIEFNNWHKYQHDSSTERMRRYRGKVTMQKRREEKREEGKRPFLSVEETPKWM